MDSKVMESMGYCMSDDTHIDKMIVKVMGGEREALAKDSEKPTVAVEQARNLSEVQRKG